MRDHALRAAQAQRMRDLNADPDFVAKKAARAVEHMRALHARRCDWCQAPFSSWHPVDVIRDESGEHFACRDADRCGTRPIAQVAS